MAVSIFTEQSAVPPQELIAEIDLRNLVATVCKFNRFGTAIAVGTASGELAVVEYATKTVILEHRMHSSPVNSVDWSYSGRYIVSACEAGTIFVYDVIAKTDVFNMDYLSPQITVIFHLKQDGIFSLLRPKERTAFAIVWKEGSKEVAYNYQKRPQIGDDVPTAISYCRFNSKVYLVIGTNKSHLIFFDANTFEYVRHVKQAAMYQIKQVYCARKHEYLVTNSTDRSIRVFRLSSIFNAKIGETIQHAAKFIDAISKKNYIFVTMSPDGHYICATEPASHELTIWDVKTATVSPPVKGKIADNPADVAWHPNRMEVVVFSKSTGYIFGRRYQVSMSAFAPDFKEISDNVLHVEKESEFDLEDDDASVASKEPEEEIEVDIFTLPVKEYVWHSSDEEDLDMGELEREGRAPVTAIPGSGPTIVEDDDDIPFMAGVLPDTTRKPRRSAAGQAQQPPPPPNDDHLFVKPMPPSDTDIRATKSVTFIEPLEKQPTDEFKPPKPKKTRTSE